MIEQLIDEIKKLRHCMVYPPAGIPKLQNTNRTLPKDVEEFYSLCDGLELYTDSEYVIKIVAPVL